MMKSVWMSIQKDPLLMRRVNGWLTMFWVAMIPVSIAMHWLTSVAYVSALSLWALVSGHWAAWQAARVEVRQDRELKNASTGTMSTAITGCQSTTKSAAAFVPRYSPSASPVPAQPGQKVAAPPSSSREDRQLF